MVQFVHGGQHHELWKHRKAVVFDVTTPSVGAVIARIESECRARKSAGLLKGDFTPFLREQGGLGRVVR